MIPVKSHLQDLVSQMHSTTDNLESVIKFLENADLTDNEKMHKVANLMFTLDLSLLANRQQFDQIRSELRKT